MRPRTTLVASVLLATATATTLAGASFAPAHAHPAAPSDGTAPIVTITANNHSTSVSATTIAPGNTVFDLVGHGQVQIMSFNGSYTIADFAKDAKKLFAGDVKTVKRVDKKVNWWGGARTGSQVAMNLPAGSYTVANLSMHHPSFTSLTVAGTPQAGTLPTSEGQIKMVGDMTYRPDKTLPHDGWITVNNRASEPHFVVLQQVKKGTTKGEVKKFLLGGAQGQPSFAKKNSYETLAISPKHSFEWFLDGAKGEYATLCFYPSNVTGAPHSLMGMVGITTLK